MAIAIIEEQIQIQSIKCYRKVFIKSELHICFITRKQVILS